MKIRTALAEKTVEAIKEVMPEAKFAVGNWSGDCVARPMEVNANFWYELRSESPGVLYLPCRLKEASLDEQLQPTPSLGKSNSGAEMVSTDSTSKCLASV